MHRATIKVLCRARLVRLSVFLVLSGCTAPPPPVPEPSAATDSDVVETRALEAPAPPAAPVSKPVPQTAAVPKPDKQINDDPKQLFGMDGHRVAALLGPASFVRRDGPAEVWQYRAKACVLDVYLYKDAGALSVAHVYLRKRSKATQAPRRCFVALIERQE